MRREVLIVRRMGYFRGRVEAERCFETEMVLQVDNRIRDIWMALIALRQKHRRANKYWASPEGRKLRAFKFHVFHPFRIGRSVNGWQNLVQCQPNVSLSIEVYSRRHTYQVSWRRGELLAFPLVEVHPNGVAVGAMTFGVYIQNRLNVIISARQLIQFHRKPRAIPVDDGRNPRFPLRYIDSENRNDAVVHVSGLESRLRTIFFCHHNQKPAGYGRIPNRRRKRDFKRCSRLRFGSARTHRFGKPKRSSDHRRDHNESSCSEVSCHGCSFSFLSLLSMEIA